MKTTFLARLAEWISISFEKLNPALFRLLAAVLPYITPFPVAWLTASNAEKFLDFTPAVAFSFVFGLEGMGLWFTSLFVDAFIDWIRSKNWKTFGLVLMFTFVVGVYVFLLVNLNVTLDAINNENSNTALSRVITLLCFLPLLTGVGNGYYKWKLEAGYEAASDKEYRRRMEEDERRIRSDERIKKTALKHGINIFKEQANSSQDEDIEKRSDWRLLSKNEKREVVYSLSVEGIMRKYGVKRSTAFEWKKRSPE